jgi:PST family polysaccharide transporter
MMAATIAERLKSLYLNQGFRKVFFNLGWMFVDKIVRMGLNFVLGAWIARYLGAERFGAWNYAIAFTALFGFVSTLGLYQIVLQELVSEPAGKNRTLGNGAFLKGAGGLALVGLSAVAIRLMHPGEPLLHQLVLIVALGYVFQCLDVIDYFFQARVQAKFIVVARTLAFVPSSLFKVYLVLTAKPLEWFAWAQTFELLLGGLFLAYLYQARHGSLLAWQVRRADLSRLFGASRYLLFSEIAIILYMRIDQVMIGNLLGEAAVGNYSAAVRLSEIWYLFPNIISSSMWAAIIKAKNIDQLAYLNKVQHLYNLLVWLAIAIGIAVTFAAPALTALFYGAEFAGAAPILTIHIWTSVFVFLGIASGQYLIIENLSNIAFYRTLAGLLVNLVLNFLLIPRYHEVGAAVATLLSQCCAAYLFDACNRSTRRMFLMKTKSFFPFLPISHAKR